MIDGLLRDLQQPEYLHVLLNPLPVYGLAVALFGLIAAMYLGSRGGQITALVLIFATAISAWPVAHYGEAAEDRVLAVADEAGQAWLKAHAHRPCFGRGDFRAEEMAEECATLGDRDVAPGVGLVRRGRIHRLRRRENPTPGIPQLSAAQDSAGIMAPISACDD